KFILAEKQQAPFVELWGTGTPRREFMHVDDLADACFFLMKTYNEAGFINIGVGEDISIIDLANLISKITGYKGEVKFDHSKPDGTPRKLMDITKLKSFGWKASIGLEEGIKMVYNELIKKELFLSNYYNVGIK
ncbi:MAG TPA: NAD-dependent epimerase/dehydratase family protein, partial [Chitinophagaceae bacterium]|nr:NAD-dependent epimerase/dehydratase family protein [Chitinophagaceae bacterium]